MKQKVRSIVYSDVYRDREIKEIVCRTDPDEVKDALKTEASEEGLPEYLFTVFHRGLVLRELKGRGCNLFPNKDGEATFQT